MPPDRLAAQTSAEPDDELYRLVSSFRAARGEGNKSLAMRLIDRARRLAPERSEINYLYGQHLLSDSPDDALPFLEKATAAQTNVIFESTAISALVAVRDLPRAGDRMAAALEKFAVAPGGPLAKLARRLSEELTPRWGGWVGIAPDLRLCGEILRCEKTTEWLNLREHRESASHDYLINVGPGGVAPFLVKLKQNLPRRLIEAHARNSMLLGGKVSFPPDFGLDGRATLNSDRLTGWVRLGWTVVDAIQVLIAGRSGFRLRIATEPDLLDPGYHRFSIDRKLCADAGNRLVVFAMLPNGSYARLPDSPLLVDPPRPPGPRPRRRPGAKASQPLPAFPAPLVDVIIPVYKGVAETLACIQSVIGTVADAEIVVIDDASPDPEMAPALDALAASGKVTLLRNARNAGFPRTVNRGFALHPDRDVVVLNSDTEVYGNWLGRLRLAAYNSPDIGSVTPLTNSGSIASYPKSENGCSSEEGAELDHLASTINDGLHVEIPTGVGFCLYLRRECLEQTGYFDTAAFGHGYGEENDFCLRANRLGWRHVLAPNIFIRHLGSRSFGSRRKALFDRNNRLINLRYPGYDADILAYHATDPAHRARRRLDEEILARAGHRHVLLVTLALEGGVRRAVNERVAFWRERGLTAISLKPDPAHPGVCVLSVDGHDFDDLAYEIQGELPELARLLERLSIDSIELHHFLDLPPELIEQLYQLGPPIDAWVHDYVWYCPRITLLNGEHFYCGEPPVSVCEACVAENGSTLNEPISVAALRDRSARWLSQARAVLAPTESLARRLRAKFSGIPVRIQPLEEEVALQPAKRRPGATLKVAVIGAIGLQKGYDVLHEAASDAAERDLPIEFIVIGYSKDDNALRESGNVFITGQYEEYEIEQLIARESPDVALFASVFPETWSYALTHALRAGLPVAAFDFGAIAERVRKAGAPGILFPLSSTPRELNDGLLKAFPVLPRPVPALLPAAAAPKSSGTELVVAKDASANMALPGHTQRLRDGMVQNLNQLTASVEVLPLVKGLYLFSVGATDSRKVGDDHELVLPALQVGLGPGTSPDHVEFMLGPRTEGAWLCEPRDHIVVKVKASSTILLLTSLRAPNMAALEIDVKRLDGPQQAARPAPAPPQKAPEPPATPPRNALALPPQRKPPADPSSDAAGQSVPLRVTVHVQRRGDMVFNESQWAGVSGQRLAVESFSILPLDELTSDLVEYKAVTASGIETPWVPGGGLCGTRGMGMPLVGFAVRMKPQDSTRDYLCEYSAVMVSGATLGPARNGAPCRSVDVGDPIESIWVSIKKANGAGHKLLDRPPEQAAAARAAKPRPAVRVEEPVPAVESTKPRAPIGPRFSVFRDPVE